MKRVIFDILLLVLLFLSPWWVGVVFAIIGLFVFKNFYEMIFSFGILYGIYYLDIIKPLNQILLFSFFVVSFYFIVDFIKSNIFLYNNN